MFKQLRILALATLMAGLAASQAFAIGALVIEHSGVMADVLTISQEIMGTSRIFSLNPATGDAIQYTLGQDLATEGNILRVRLTGGVQFNAVSYRVCDGIFEVAEFAPPGSTTQIDFNLTNSQFPLNILPAGDVLDITTNTCGAGGNHTASFVFPGGQGQATTTNVNICVEERSVGGALPIGPEICTLMAILRPQYPSYVINNSTHIIDVVVGTGGEFTPATGRNSDGTTGSGQKVLADSRQGDFSVNPSLRFSVVSNDMNVGNNPLGCTPGVSCFFARGKVRPADPVQLFQAVRRVLIGDASTICDSTVGPVVGGNLVQSSLNPVGSSPLSPMTLPTTGSIGTGFDETLSATRDYRFCVRVNGTDFINPRQLTTSLNVDVSGGDGNFQDPPESSQSNVQLWNLSGGDIRVTGVRAGSGNETNISLNNMGVPDGAITRLEVFRIDATGTAAAPACVRTADPTVNKPVWANGGATLRGSEINASCSGVAPFVLTESYGVRLVTTITPGNLGAKSERIMADGRVVVLPVLKLGNAFPNE